MYDGLRLLLIAMVLAKSPISQSLTGWAGTLYVVMWLASLDSRCATGHSLVKGWGQNGVWG